MLIIILVGSYTYVNSVFLSKKILTDENYDLDEYNNIILQG